MKKRLVVYQCPLCKVLWSSGEGATPLENDFKKPQVMICSQCENTPKTHEELAPEFGYGVDY